MSWVQNTLGSVNKDKESGEKISTINFCLEILSQI